MTGLADFAYLRGVNAAGGEFSSTPATLPGVQGVDYAYNTLPFMQYLRARGHRIVRLPFAWERIQHALSTPLDPTGLAELRAAIQAAADADLLVLLDMHNYAKYTGLNDVQVKFDAGITTADFADAWTRIVAAVGDIAAIVSWGLMNEPNNLPDTGPARTWATYSQAAVTAIRATGDTRTINVCGNDWSGTNGWPKKNGPPWITDPANSIVYEAHYYFAANNSGVYPATYAELETDAQTRGYPSLAARVTDELTDFTTWCKTYEVRGFIGEVGWPFDTDPDAYNAIGETIYRILDAARIGATYWATGTRWSPTYRLQAYAHDTTKTVFTPNAQTTVIEAHPTQRCVSAADPP